MRILRVVKSKAAGLARSVASRRWLRNTLLVSEAVAVGMLALFAFRAPQPPTAPRLALVQHADDSASPTTSTTTSTTTTPLPTTTSSSSRDSERSILAAALAGRLRVAVAVAPEWEHRGHGERTGDERTGDQRTGDQRTGDQYTDYQSRRPPPCQARLVVVSSRHRRIRRGDPPRACRQSWTAARRPMGHRHQP